MYLDQVLDHLALFLALIFAELAQAYSQESSSKVIGAKFIFDHSLAILEVCFVCYVVLEMFEKSIFI